MRNIVLYDQSISLPTLYGGTCMTIDVDSDTVYVYSRDGMLLGFNHGQISFELSLISIGGSPALYPEETLAPTAVNITHLPDLESVCIIMLSGEIVIVDLPSATASFAGNVDPGIECAAWSPDQEVIALVSAAPAHKLLTLTRSLDLLTEASVRGDGDFGEAAPVNVGWGSVQTQFRGTEGKYDADKIALAVAGMCDAIAPIASKEQDSVNLAWRGDGQFFAVGTRNFQQNDSRRLFRVYSRDAVLQSTSEDVIGLESTLAWRPAGNLLASTQRLPHRYDVVLFERCGLRRAEFTLPFERDAADVEYLSWNSDSSVLAIVIKLREGAGKIAKNIVQLWHSSNYHWYLKEELRFDDVSDHNTAVTDIEWHPESPLRLYVLLHSGRLLDYNFCWETAASRDPSATCLVVDSSNVLVTPFAVANVPPPMALHIIATDMTIRAVAPAPVPNKFVVLSSDDTISVFASDGGSRVCPVLLDKLKSVWTFSDFSTLRLPAWLDAYNILFVRRCPENNIDMLVRFIIDPNTEMLTECDSSIPAPGPIACICAIDGGLLLETNEGALFRCTLPQSGADEVDVSSFGMLPTVCRWLSATTVSSHDERNAKLLIIGLTERGTLYSICLDSKFGVLSADTTTAIDVNNQCTSFALTDGFLLFTTSAHMLHVISINVSGNVHPVSPVATVSEKVHAADQSLRSVERGARIVTASGRAVKVVLQMPRGNVETVSPRAMVLKAIRVLLDRQEFRAAFLVARLHRIDLNILYDHSPTSFAACSEKFVEQLASEPSHLSLFLSSLRDDDVTKSMYAPSSTLMLCSAEEARVDGKVNTVCNLLRDAITVVDEDGLLLPLLSTYIKRSPPQLEEVLLRLKNLSSKKKEDDDIEMLRGQNQTKVSKIISSERALAHVIFLADVDVLYDTALGLYDFDLVLLVAGQSQRDPQEYLADLRSLSALSLHERRFTIDVRLRRYSKALRSLICCGEDRWSDVVPFVKEHGLFEEAIALYDGRLPIDNTEIDSSKDTSSIITPVADDDNEMMANLFINDNDNELSLSRQVSKLKKKSNIDANKLSALLVAFGEHLQAKKQFTSAAATFLQAGALVDALNCFVIAGDYEMSFVVSARLKHTSSERLDVAERIANVLIAMMKHDDVAMTWEMVGEIERAVESCITASLWRRAVTISYRHCRGDLIETTVRPGFIAAVDRSQAYMTDLFFRFTKHTNRLPIARAERQRRREQMEEAMLGGEDIEGDWNDLFSDTTSLAGSLSSRSSRSRSSKRSGRSSRSGDHRAKKAMEKKITSLREGGQYEVEALMKEIGRLATDIDNLRESITSSTTMALYFSLRDAAVLLQCNYLILQRAVVDSLSASFPPIDPDDIDEEFEWLNVPIPVAPVVRTDFKWIEATLRTQVLTPFNTSN